MAEKPIGEEQLVGYVCGALEVEEVTLFEQTLDGQARLQVEVVRIAFQPLDGDRDDCEPPSDLAKRCCQKLREMCEKAKSAAKTSGECPPQEK